MCTCYHQETTWQALQIGEYFLFQEDWTIYRKVDRSHYREQTEHDEKADRPIYLADLPVARIIGLQRTPGRRLKRFCDLPFNARFRFEIESPGRENHLYKWAEDSAGPFPWPAPGSPALASIKMNRVPVNEGKRLDWVVELPEYQPAHKPAAIGPDLEAENQEFAEMGEEAAAEQVKKEVEAAA